MSEVFYSRHKDIDGKVKMKDILIWIKELSGFDIMDLLLWWFFSSLFFSLIPVYIDHIYDKLQNSRYKNSKPVIKLCQLYDKLNHFFCV